MTFDYLDNATLQCLNRNAYQEANIIVQFKNGGQSVSLHNSDIIAGSFSLDRYSTSTSNITLGTAIASELDFEIDNHDGRFNDKSFAGARLTVSIVIPDVPQTSQSRTIPLGYFFVEGSPRSLSTIKIRALDNMVKTDVPVDKSNLTFPCTIADLITASYAETGVPFDTIQVNHLDDFPNYDLYIADLPATDGILTWRQLLAWCAGILGTNLFIDWKGYLKLAWYEPGDYFDIDPTKELVIEESNRYSSNVFSDTISVTGLFYKGEDNHEWLYGSPDYVMDLSNNKLIEMTRVSSASTEAQPSVLLANLYNNVIVGYRRFEATIKPAPYLFPMDPVLYTIETPAEDPDDPPMVEYIPTILTHTHYVLNGVTSIQAIGETTEEHQVAPDASGATTMPNVYASNVHVVNNLSVPEGGFLKVLHLSTTASMSTSTTTTAQTVSVVPGDGWTAIGVVGFRASNSYIFIYRAILNDDKDLTISARYTGTNSTGFTATLYADVLCMRTS